MSSNDSLAVGTDLSLYLSNVTSFSPGSHAFEEVNRISTGKKSFLKIFHHFMKLEIDICGFGCFFERPTGPFAKNRENRDLRMLLIIC